MNSKYVTIFAGFVLLGGFLFYFFSPTITQSSSFNVKANIQPRHPGPNEEVMITLSGIGFDLKNSHYSWRKDGVEFFSGTGKRRISFETGELAEKTLINIVINPPNREIFVKNITINPTQVDLLISSDSYTPPNYKGAALPTRGSTVTVTAIPHLTENGTRITNNNLIFDWQINGQKIPERSGRGRSKLEINNVSNNQRIGVTVTGPGGDLAAENRTVIELHTPEINIYEVEPLLGPNYYKNLQDRWLPTEREFTLQIEPFYIPDRYLDTLRYFWQFDGSLVSNPSNQARKHNFVFQPETNINRPLTAGMMSRVSFQDVLTKTIILSPEQY